MTDLHVVETTGTVVEPADTPLTFFTAPATWLLQEINLVEEPYAVPFVCEVNASGLTNAALRWMQLSEVTVEFVAKLQKLMAPRIRAWNVPRFDEETGEEVPAPSPADVGAVAFADVNPFATWACRAALIVAATARAAIQKNGLRPSASGPETTPENSSEPSSTPEKTPRRRGRKASTAT